MIHATLLGLAVASALGCGGGGGQVAEGTQAATGDPAATNPTGGTVTTPRSGSAPIPGTAPPRTDNGGTTGSGVATPSGPTQNVIKANPSSYLNLVRSLQPGDTLELAAGDYDVVGDVPGLPLFNLNGTASQPIVITGPASGAPARLLGRSTHNTVRLSGSSYLVIRNLEIDGRDLGGAGVAAQGVNHHITLENLTIRGVGSDQQVVGISLVAGPNWNWTIRGNTILGAGTGMYLGNSDGTNAFVAGLIENNLIRDSIGYNLQIKHQAFRPALAGMPTGKSVTVIRNNVFSKGMNSAAGSMARPNLLVGHFPPSGSGAEDHYEIYGNFFWQNPTEALFQGEGNIGFYGNLLVNHTGAGVNIQPHHDVPKEVRVFGNTVVAKNSGIRVSGVSAGHAQRVQANAVFSDQPIAAADQRDNQTGGYDQAPAFLAAPHAGLGAFDAFPLPSALSGPSADTAGLSAYRGWDRDFNGQARDWSIRGAYSGQGVNPGWKPGLTRR